MPVIPHISKGNFETMALEIKSELDRIANELFPEGDDGRFVLAHEKGPNDFVTDRDISVDTRLSKFLTERFVCSVYSEERACVWPPKETQYWVIDPIDGTHNLSRRWSAFGIMGVLIENDAPVFSFIYFPFAWGMRREMYFAGRNLGAWVADQNGYRSIMTSRHAPLKESFVLLEGPVRLMRPEMLCLAPPASGGIRVCLSCAVSFTALARGWREGRNVAATVALNNKPWDNLPAVLMVREAGGFVADREGLSRITVHNCTDLIGTNSQENMKKILGILEESKTLRSLIGEMC